ncbi:MAG: hypothetical protein FWD79_10495 [Desulfobulbus sp.]|nr:hypothetical protein [Desulfobulbus sp.]
MRKLAFFASLSIVLTAAIAHAAANMTDYCQAPPFVSATLPPNILLVVDISTSMSGTKAYSYSGATYNASDTYEGYFDPDKDYVQDSSGVWVEIPGGAGCSSICTGTWSCGNSNKTGCVSATQSVLGQFGQCAANSSYRCCNSSLVNVTCGAHGGNGNYLNWYYMTRFDVLLWAMTGGTPSGCTTTNKTVQYCDASQYGGAFNNPTAKCDATGCILSTFNAVKIKARWDRINGPNGGLLYQLINLPVQPRIGAMFFSTPGVSKTILIGDLATSAKDFNADQPYQNTIAALNAMTTTGSTATGLALWSAYAYFSQKPSVFGGPAPASATDASTAWKNPLYQCLDKNNKNADGSCIFVPVPCAKNFMILLSDGEWNTGMGSSPTASTVSTYSIDTGYTYNTGYTTGGYSADPVVPAYNLHKLGFTNPALPADARANVQTLYSLGLWLTGIGDTAMRQIALYGGFDTSRQWPGNLSDFPRVTYTDPGSNCTKSNSGYKGSLCVGQWPPPSSDWNTTGIPATPDNYLSATSGLQIKNQIIAIIYDLMKKASSGTAVSGMGSSGGSGATMLQSTFYPKRSFNNGTEVSWTSDLMNYWYYLDPFFSSMLIHEDTVREGADYTLFDLQKDYITSFAYDDKQGKTLASLWEGIVSDATYRGQVLMENSKAIWRAGFNLWWTDPQDRTVYTSLDGSTLKEFNTGNSDSLAPYLGKSRVDADATINYVLGYECADATTGAACVCGSSDNCTAIGRSRTVTTGVCSIRKSPCGSNADCPGGETCGQETHVWKMGDIISSTPRIMGPGALNAFNLATPYGYNDQSYDQFVKSNYYKARQLVFSGTNGGMLHAFWLGKILQTTSGSVVARLEGKTSGPGGIGTEAYAFIPKNALPYLQYLQDVDYCHLYMVDGPMTLTDASIYKPSSCTEANYWDCPKTTQMITMAVGNSNNDVDFTNTSWRTVLIGSMGTGGATCSAAQPDSNRIMTPLAAGGEQVGWSSYFALDVTNQASPQLLWEFSDPGLGVTNVGAAIVKVGGKINHCSLNAAQTCSTDRECGWGTCVSNASTNGRWFAVLASGSTGPIKNSEFQGTSNNTLKLFVLDLATGEKVRTFDTGITNAFAGSISSSTLDLDRSSAKALGNYQDDVLYIGYVRNPTSSKDPSLGTKGGVLRLAINGNVDPAQWTVSKVFADDELGPVTASVMNLIDQRAGQLWLYLAEGRYFFKQDNPASAVRYKLLGVQDPCYNKTTNSIDSTCTTQLRIVDLQDQTTPATTLAPATQQGWYISLDPANSSSGSTAERVITNPTIDPQGAIYFVSFAPTADVCGFGGNTYVWAVDYKTGGEVPYLLQGKALIQTSTGAVQELDLGNTFSGRRSAGFGGIPPAGTGIMVVTAPTPIRQFMHIQEE